VNQPTSLDKAPNHVPPVKLKTYISPVFLILIATKVSALHSRLYSAALLKIVFFRLFFCCDAAFAVSE
jgi:hypothetical protein